jgi:hypothetical protein
LPAKLAAALGLPLAYNCGKHEENRVINVGKGEKSPAVRLLASGLPLLLALTGRGHEAIFADNVVNAPTRPLLLVQRGGEGRVGPEESAAFTSRRATLRLFYFTFPDKYISATWSTNGNSRAPSRFASTTTVSLSST